MDMFQRAVVVALFSCGGASFGAVAGVTEGAGTPPPAESGTRFEFEVIESTDAAYLGDTPGHMGRAGGLAWRPNVAIGDGVFRTRGQKTKRIGTISRVRWERASGGLVVEFDPAPLERVAVGEVVWIDLNPATVAAEPD